MGAQIFYKRYDGEGRTTFWSGPATGRHSACGRTPGPRAALRNRPEFATDGRRFFFTVTERMSDIWSMELRAFVLLLGASGAFHSQRRTARGEDARKTGGNTLPRVKRGTHEPDSDVERPSRRIGSPSGRSDFKRCERCVARSRIRRFRRIMRRSRSIGRDAIVSEPVPLQRARCRLTSRMGCFSGPFGASRSASRPFGRTVMPPANRTVKRTAVGRSDACRTTVRRSILTPPAVEVVEPAHRPAPPRRLTRQAR
jgi:hypothetical protein